MRCTDEAHWMILRSVDWRVATCFFSILQGFCWVPFPTGQGVSSRTLVPCILCAGCVRDLRHF
jgi:hypothetical protein